MLKPLVQSQYKMQIIEDLGNVLPKSTSNKAYRYAIFKCNKCELQFKAMTDNMRKRNREFCEHCERTMKPVNIDSDIFSVVDNLGINDGRRYVMLKCNECDTEVKTRSDYVNRIKCDKCHFKRLSVKHPRLHRIWDGMKRRCYSKKNKDYKYYGEKGVTICNEWVNDFESFLSWSLNNGYKNNLTIDKDILCDELKIYPKIYSPYTCKWVTVSENSSYSNKGVLKPRVK